MKKIEVIYKTPGGIIWKLLPDEKGDVLVVESRDAERRKVLLSSIDIANSSFLFTTDSLPKTWWLGLMAVEKEGIVVQGYKESNSPEPKGYYVFDLKTGKLLKSEEELVFEKKEKDIFPEVCLFPLLYNQEDEYYNSIKEFLSIQQFDCIGPIEYLEFQNAIFISFYILENTKLTNILLVINEIGEVVLKDILIEGAKGVGQSSFFICKGSLIYTKNKTILAFAKLI